MRRAGAQAPPTVLETLRLNLTVFERAVEKGDGGTAKRSIDAAERMFSGLRDVASGQGCDVGPSTWQAAPSNDEHPSERATIAPPTPAPEDSGAPGVAVANAELESVVRRVLAQQRHETFPPPPPAWIGKLSRREWSGGVLGRLTWAWICCAASLCWRGVRRVFR